MDTDIQYRKVIAHVSGLTDDTKAEFVQCVRKSRLAAVARVVDLDAITSTIVQDKNMTYLMNRLEEAMAGGKKPTLKSKDLEKRIQSYWKSKLEYHVLKFMRNEKKALILIGYNTFFKNHRVALSFSVPFCYFVKTDYEKHARSLITSHLDQYRQDIIDGSFDLNFLDAGFLIKRRMNIEAIYAKMGYLRMTIPDIVASIEESQTRDTPGHLFYASPQLVKRIPPATVLHPLEWVALVQGAVQTKPPDVPGVSDAGASAEAKVNLKTKQAKLPTKAVKALNKQTYLYELVPDDELVPLVSGEGAPTRYITSRPLKIHKQVAVTNPYKHLVEQLKVRVQTMEENND